MERLIKYLRHPAFSAAQLTTRNPYLDKGEIVFELDGTAKPKKFKIGPGHWNDLPYFIDDEYTISTPVTNPIGDATGDISGLSLREVLEKILHPYVAPVVSNVVNNAGGSFGNARIIEIGISLSGTIQVTYSVSNPSLLSGATPISITAGGIFSNEGAHAHSGSIGMTLPAPLNPSVITTYTISVKATHQQGETPVVTSTIKFNPRAIWGVSTLTSYTAGDINSLTSKQTALLSSHKRDYTFNGQGYCVVAIPAMLNPTNMIFTDVTDPSAPAGFSMEDLGTLSINNGVGTYLYQILRSTYFITQPSSILRIS